MILSEFIQRSPIRLFESIIHGGLKPGELGLIASQTGVGKTSVLVQLALDKLLQGKKIIHVSFTQHAQYVITWYEEIFNELISKRNLENADAVKDESVKNRVLMNFNQDGMPAAQILKSLRAMILDGGFAAESLIIDGFDFYRTNRESIELVKAFANEMGLSVWYSCTVREKGQQYDSENIPLVIKDFSDLINVVIVLNANPDHIELSVSRDSARGNMKSAVMRLDPKTLLISGK